MEGLVYKTAFRNMPGGVVVLRRDGRVHYLNPAAGELLGLRPEEVLKQDLASLLAGRVRPVGREEPLSLKDLAGMCFRGLEVEYTSPAGAKKFFLADTLLLAEEGGKVYGTILAFRDFTEHKKREEELRDMAVRDGLTLLFNHTFFMESLEAEVSRAQETGGKLALLMLDVDNFKLYNDRFGHPQGDEVLRRLARLLEENVREGDLVGRYGGDEFVVLLPGLGPKEAFEIAERLRMAVATHPFPYREFLPGGKVTVSLGIACFPEDGVTAAELIRSADEAMYSAKHLSKDKVEVYRSVLKELEVEWPEARAVIHHVSALLAAVNNRDLYTYSHSERVTRYAEALALRLGLPAWEVRKVKMAAFLHDVGKIDLPPSLLNKPGCLTEEERAEVQRHPRRRRDRGPAQGPRGGGTDRPPPPRALGRHRVPCGPQRGGDPARGADSCPCRCLRCHDLGPALPEGEDARGGPG